MGTQAPRQPMATETKAIAVPGKDETFVSERGVVITDSFGRDPLVCPSERTKSMTLGTAKPLMLFTVCAALASSLGVALSSCGGSSGNGRPDGGGSTNTGGTSNGGATGTGGAVGTGGASAACTLAVPPTGLVCDPGLTPVNPLITDFTEATWNNTAGKFGCGLTGAPFSYGGAKTTSTITAQVDTMGHKLVLVGNVDSGDYGGGGLAFDQCADATAYGGVQFTLGGSTGGCDVVLQVQTFVEKPTTGTPAGGCTTACYSFPQLKLATTSGSVTVRFADLMGGMPTGATEIAKQVVGLQWQFQSPPPPPVDGGLQVSCGNISMSITDVKFVP